MMPFRGRAEGPDAATRPNEAVSGFEQWGGRIMSTEELGAESKFGQRGNAHRSGIR